MKILSLKRDITPKMAKDILLKKETSIDIKSVKAIYYPYYRLDISVKTRVLTHKVDSKLSCLIDMVQGVEAVTGEINDKEEIEVDNSAVLDPILQCEEAKNKAMEYARHTVIQTMKLLKLPKITPLTEEFFYKPFWVIGCSNRKDEPFYLLMDSISGAFHLLDLE